MDKLTSQQRSKCMSRIRSADTKPELIVRRWLWSRGYRYRKNCRRLPGTPDIVLRRYGAAIFVHGCFWHGHESHLRLPKTNVEFWEKKIARNRERDEQNKAKLREMGWSVLTVWECQLRPPVRHATLMEIESFLNRSFLARHGDVKKVRAYSYGEEVVPMAAEPEE
ncbi:MAG: DNA mismatch endonuclease Vsr [Muribaculaceae bacterium]|nr:DNA mismatch endonuclease Vsr [Muribaculaceae bacterium]MBQ7211737.1 DNA mismatch endonuclease Vsr [Muribaculaceae bacterium]